MLPRETGTSRNRQTVWLGSESAAARHVAALSDEGWLIVDADEVPEVPADLTDVLMCVRVTSECDRGAVVLALSRGASVTVASSLATADLVHELARGAPVVELADASDEQLSDEQRALLEALAAGSSVGDAAAALHISTRTAHRRIKEACRILGVDRTAAAVARLRADGA